MDELTEKQLLELLDNLAETEVEEIDCDAFLDRLGPYAEEFCAKGAVSDKFMAEAQHLRVCRECKEEFMALLSILRKDET